MGQLSLRNLQHWEGIFLVEMNNPVNPLHVNPVASPVWSKHSCSLGFKPKFLTYLQVPKMSFSYPPILPCPNLLTISVCFRLFIPVGLPVVCQRSVGVSSKAQRKGGVNVAKRVVDAQPSMPGIDLKAVPILLRLSPVKTRFLFVHIYSWMCKHVYAYTHTHIHTSFRILSLGLDSFPL